MSTLKRRAAGNKAKFPRLSMHNERSTLLKPFRRVHIQPWNDETIAAYARHYGTSEDEMRRQFEDESRASFFQNGSEPEDYFVSVQDKAPGVMGPVFWLSIRRRKLPKDN